MIVPRRNALRGAAILAIAGWACVLASLSWAAVVASGVGFGVQSWVRFHRHNMTVTCPDGLTLDAVHVRPDGGLLVVTDTALRVWVVPATCTAAPVERGARR